MNNRINNEGNGNFSVMPPNPISDDEYLDDDGSFGNNDDTVDADGDPTHED